MSRSRISAHSDLHRPCDPQDDARSSIYRRSVSMPRDDSRRPCAASQRAHR
jgi:hypothetical protein